MFNHSIAGQHRRTRSAPTAPAEHRAAATPKALTWITLGLAAVVILHLVVPIVMVIERETIAEGIRQANGTLAPDVIDIAVRITLIAGALFHRSAAILIPIVACIHSDGSSWSRRWR